MPVNFDPTTGLQNAQQTYYFANTQNGTQQTGANTGNQMNAYTAGQQALQGQLPQTLMSFLSGGGVPDYFTAPPQVFQAYNDAFNNWVKPGLVAQYGAGSPQIGSQQSLGNEQLAANLYQSGMQNYMGALNSANSLAFTPVGASNTTTTNQNWQTDNNVHGYQGDNALGTMLSRLTSLI